jgi:lauroyl/myristoyl acyltransferase
VIGDVARYAYWVELRRALDPSQRKRILALGRAIGTAQYHAARSRRPLLGDELARTFPERAWGDAELRAVARSAYVSWAQCLVEELLLGKLDVDNIDPYIRFDGRENLDRALEKGKGALYMFPHAGNYMFGIALTSLSGYPLTQLAARGFPPPERQIAAEVMPSKLNIAAREARDAAEDRLPARFVDMERDSTRELYRTLRRNELVGLAYDGRGGSKFTSTNYLGRPALMATGPWRLAASTGAAICPVVTIRDADQRQRLIVCPPVFPDMGAAMGTRCEALQRGYLDHMEPILRANPDHYARWLLHCRVRVSMDDHPMFVDVAPDDAWRKYEHAEF